MKRCILSLMGFGVSFLVAASITARAVVPSPLPVIAQTLTSVATVFPTEGVPGSEVELYGTLEGATNGFRFVWDQNGEVRVLATAPPSPGDNFGLFVHVPQDAVPGDARIAVAREGTLERPSVGADFVVLPPDPARITGFLNDVEGRPVPGGVPVRLRDQRGLTVAETVTDPSGAFTFSGLADGGYIVEPTDGTYPPQGTSVGAGGSQNLVFAPSSVLTNIPPLFLVNAGAIALPGGTYTGTQNVQVGDWTSMPFARLVSLQGKGRPPLTVRFWAELKHGLLPSNAPLVVVFELLRGDGSSVLDGTTSTLTLVSPAPPHNFSAFTWDVNSLELPPGALTLRVSAVTTLFQIVGQWSFPVEVVGLGNRWFSDWVKNPQLSVTRKNFFELQHSYQATLPDLPGPPLFDEPLDLYFTTVANRFDLGVQVKESFCTAGAWSGAATAQASLTLFDQDLSGPFGGTKTLVRSGASLPASTYTLMPGLTVPLPGPISIPVYGAGALPAPIDICGMTFNGALGVFLEFSGQVAFTAGVENDLRLIGLVTPSLDVALPALASLEMGVCEGHASIKPEANFAVPIEIDPAATPPVGWSGLCVTLSGKASASLSCCDIINVHPSFNLFDPIHLGDCPAGAAPMAAPAINDNLEVPPLNASVAVGPLGQAIAVWDNVVYTNDAPYRTAPFFSVYDGNSWSAGAPMADDSFAGWDPQVTFIGPAKVLVIWIRPYPAASPDTPVANGPVTANSACSEIGGAIQGILCSGLGFISDVVGAVGDFFGFIPPAEGPGANDPSVQVSWHVPQPIINDNLFDLRPVLAGNPSTGEAMAVWLREQEVLVNQLPLALYTSTYGPDGWSAPERLDPNAQEMDIQPSVRFDRNGSPAVAWIRDADANLGTTEDRQLLYAARGRAGWSAPEIAVWTDESPWTPSLDFDVDNAPVVAFVIPPFDAGTGQHWPADGATGFIETVRRVQTGNWPFIGTRPRGEHPILRISKGNTAVLLFRASSSPAAGAGGSGVTAAVADLALEVPDWHMAPLARDGMINWRLAGDMDVESGASVVLWESRNPLQPGEAPTIRREHRALELDLAFGGEGLLLANPYANPGEAIGVTAHLVNLGLLPFRNGIVEVHFYDREPVDGVRPFATRTFEGSLDATSAPGSAVSADYLVHDRSRHQFYVVLDPDNLVSEGDETNNILQGTAGGVPPPEGLSAAPLAGSDGVYLAWRSSAAGGSVRHWIWRSTDGGGWVLIGGTVAMAFTDTSAVAGLAYAYRVTTVDDTGEESDEETTNPVVVPPADPAALAEEVRLHLLPYGGAGHLMWNVVPGARLESVEHLTPGFIPWLPVEGGVREVGGAASFTLPLNATSRFYRVLWQN